MQRSSSDSHGSASPPVGRSMRTSSVGTASPSGRGRPLVSALPPPPAGVAAHGQSNFSQQIAKSMTIEEMRELHQRALRDAEAKSTELRLVLASRYRELVGSSDEVIRMKERAKELHELVNALPAMIQKLAMSSTENYDSKVDDDVDDDATATSDEVEIRRQLSTLPRIVHRFLDEYDVHKSTTSLIRLFSLIASQTDVYPLANALSKRPASKQRQDMDPALQVQMRMVFLQMQSLPHKISRLAERILLRPASHDLHATGASRGAMRSAAALSAINLLSVEKQDDRAGYLLEKYYDSKAHLLKSLLDELAASDKDGQMASKAEADSAEEILSKIVLMLQHDVIMHPYQVFIKRRFPGASMAESDDIMHDMPFFDPSIIQERCSKFLSSHLPLIRTKVKSVLVTIAGTTASALGQIRQSLYDKTDGTECMERLNNNEICTWDEAVAGMVDFKSVLSHNETRSGGQRFSLWGILFSTTFTSLVHNILTTSFQSVHSRVVSTLRDSLANAPPMSSILPHEAYRNALKISSDLDHALLKVSNDAHELLVHAEEREDSERRLRQSLYVQTCEIMGRLVLELRRMIFREPGDKSEATKELIVGRLCYLLKFRLTSLAKLLDPTAVSRSGGTHQIGMIEFIDLQSAFDLADDNDDGLITFQEALEAVDSAFSGTQYRGADMLLETLLLNEGKNAEKNSKSIPENITLSELALLTARGLKHDESGGYSALGSVQKSLDKIVSDCLREWVRASLDEADFALGASVEIFAQSSVDMEMAEWSRMYGGENADLRSYAHRLNISPHFVAYVLEVSAILTRNTSPPDSLFPAPSHDYASSLGLSMSSDSVLTFCNAVRLALVCHTLDVLHRLLDSTLRSVMNNMGELPFMQLHLDLSFLRTCFVEGTFGSNTSLDATMGSHLKELAAINNHMESKVRRVYERLGIPMSSVSEKVNHVLEATDLFLTPIFGKLSGASVSQGGELKFAAKNTSTVPLIHSPLPSTRRFALLPIQSDRSLNELSMRGKFSKEAEERPDAHGSSGGVMSTGLGFLSSMLKKK